MSFHAATANMAALLRSARMLKISPSGLLHITGTKRTGPPLSRLYSGALGATRTGTCSRLLGSATEHSSISRVWPHAAGCLRGYAVSTNNKDDANTLVSTKQALVFDWALERVDNAVKRSGRITKTMLLEIFQNICRTGFPSGNQTLLLLRSCGSLLPEVPPQERVLLADSFWDKLKKQGVQFDVSHYNALLRVYEQNEHKFSPTDFLANMETNNVHPNRVTYERLIAAYCQTGDINGASTILGFMKTKDLPITEDVFISLVTGHARAGDMENAKNIVQVMHGAGMEAGPRTYIALMNAYAEKGDIDSLKKTKAEAESAGCSLMDRDVMQVVYTLAVSGHKEHVSELMEQLKHERSYVPDAINLCLRLITLGQQDVAFEVLKTLSKGPFESYNESNLGNFFLRHCVNVDTPLEKLMGYCEELKEVTRHTNPLPVTLEYALQANKMAMSLELMKIMKEQGSPIRIHYFFPLLCPHVNNKNTKGVLEVLKAVKDFDLELDRPTISLILPAFPNTQEAIQAIRETGLSIKSDKILSVEARIIAGGGNLSKLYTHLSDPAHPPLDYYSFRSQLIRGFRLSKDVDSMVKITELLYTDKRFTREGASPAEGVSYLLYYVFESQQKNQLETLEPTLHDYLQQLKARGITISRNVFKGIQNQLNDQDLPELLKAVEALAAPESPTRSNTSDRFNREDVQLSDLQKRIAAQKAEDQPCGSTLKQIIRMACESKDLPLALEMKLLYESDMTPGCYAQMIDLCCQKGEIDTALNLKAEMRLSAPSDMLSTTKCMNFAAALSNAGRLDELIDLLKEMTELDQFDALFIRILNNFVPKGDTASIQQLQETIFALGLVKPTSNSCAPLISAYIQRGDLSGALKAAEDYQRLYSQLPQFHEIFVALVESGDTELLEQAMDIVSRVRGEMYMLYDIFFAFLEKGRYTEAQSIVESPGMRAWPTRLLWFAERCITGNNMETLEKLVDLTAKLPQSDRDEMYFFVLRLCKKTKDCDKASATWTKMQEEGLSPRERTMHLLAEILKDNGQELPSDLTGVWPVPQKTLVTDVEYQERVMTLCKKHKTREAILMVKEANKRKIALTPKVFNNLICALLAEGNLDDSMVIKDLAKARFPNFQLSNTANNLMIVTESVKGRTDAALDHLKSFVKDGHLPSNLSISKLVKSLAEKGDVAGIDEVQSLLPTAMISKMFFVNQKALANIKNDDVDSAIEVLEEVFTKPGQGHHRMSTVFMSLLTEGNDKALDKLSAMAERLGNHFACYTPATDLFLELLSADKVEDAKFMLARCNAVAEQKGQLFNWMTNLSHTPGLLNKIQTLLTLIPNVVEKPQVYELLMNCHTRDGDLTSAKALYEQMQQEGVEPDQLSLKQLAKLYELKGETAPFAEPVETFSHYARLRKTATEAAE